MKRGGKQQNWSSSSSGNSNSCSKSAIRSRWRGRVYFLCLDPLSLSSLSLCLSVCLSMGVLVGFDDNSSWPALPPACRARANSFLLACLRCFSPAAGGGGRKRLVPIHALPLLSFSDMDSLSLLSHSL
jgi:hypothetical protein